jgi:hypothetical protein
MTDEPATLPYRLRQEFLSPAEMTFYRVLVEMVNEHWVVCPKVALQDLFFVTRPNENVQYFNKLYRKNIDFLLLHCKTLKPALAVELDYPQQTNHRPADDFLDGLCAAAGLPLVHVTVVDKYDVTALAARFREAMKTPKEAHPAPRHADYSPVCPKCGITMVLRIHRTGPQAGRQYYGCLNYPQCMEVVAVER